MDPIREIGSALASARLITLQAEGEGRAVESTFRISIAHNSKVVPNGVDIDAAVDVLADRDIDVLVVGRIEERKNQLFLATALANTGWTVVFVGAPNRRNPEYVRHFLRIVEASDNLTHRGHVSHGTLRELMARSRVCASASYFEVVSLAELESVGYGCQLVASDASYLPEYLNGSARFLDPRLGGDAWLEAISVACRAGANREGMRHVRSTYSLPLTYQRLRDAYAAAGLLE
jgi:glycosyltransferase involved in cell wall biosynthesis